MPSHVYIKEGSQINRNDSTINQPASPVVYPHNAFPTMPPGSHPMTNQNSPHPPNKKCLDYPYPYGYPYPYPYYGRYGYPNYYNRDLYD
jgi:hypothetical protein